MFAVFEDGLLDLLPCFPLSPHSCILHGTNRRRTNYLRTSPEACAVTATSATAMVILESMSVWCGVEKKTAEIRFSALSSMPSSIVLAGIAACFYTGWALTQKAGSDVLGPKELQLITTLVMAVFITVAYLAASPNGLRALASAPLGGVGIAAASGLCAVAGGYFFTAALASGGEASVVSAVVATYPALVFVVSVAFFGEEAPPSKIIGVAFAMLSAFAFAYKPAAAAAVADLKAD